MDEKRNFLRKDHYKVLTNRVIAMLENAKEWERPWSLFENRPYNPVTGTKYRGVNLLSLLASNHNDPRFLTFNNIRQLEKQMQIKDPNAKLHLKKGSVGIPIFKSVLRIINEGEEDERRYSIPVYAGTVFNAEDIEGMPALIKTQAPFSPVEHAEMLAKAMVEETGLKIIEGKTSEAFYETRTDSIHLPPRSAFFSPEAFYATQLHELAHSTGHPSRLNRPLKGRRNISAYAFEELIAELSSVFMAVETGVPFDRSHYQDSANYIKEYIDAMRKDSKIIFAAASKASQACDYQLKILNDHLQKLAIKNGVDPETLNLPEVKINTSEFDVPDEEDEELVSGVEIEEKNIAYSFSPT